jgi:butyryl-CoA dehydrogenase
MSAKFFSMRNLRFLLFETHDVMGLTEFDYFGGHRRHTFDMVLDEAARMAAALYRPHLEEMDRIPPELVGGRVHVHPSVAEVMREAGDGGWIGASFPADHGGEQLPLMVSRLCYFIFAAANYSASVYPELTSGAAHLIATFADARLRSVYLPPMLAGRWQGTMALTEPQAGSSLGDIITTAVPTPTGDFRIRGQKIFISAGDHDQAENVVHLMLARIEGAPVGTKGISLFVVPKLRPDAEGHLTPNDVAVAGLYHKLGYRGAPITELSLGDKNDCRGWLVGEPHRGLAYMFQMMNEARIGVGIGAAAIASAAYHAALSYARERPQGRRLGEKDPAKPQVPIISHADVKRMLLFQRAVVEGSLSLILQCCRYADLQRAASGEAAETAGLLLDLLTPVAKSYPSEMGIHSISQGLQCFGGYGYCDDFPLEQYYRDARIHPIHEGTTGIQAMDLLGRKVIMQGGRAFALFSGEVQQAVAAAKAIDELRKQAMALENTVAELNRVTGHLAAVAQEQGGEVFLADAVLYLEAFGIVAVAWQWLLQALSAHAALNKPRSRSETDFYSGKRFAFRYFFSYELPKTDGLFSRLREVDPLTVEISARFFTD